LGGDFNVGTVVVAAGAGGFEGERKKEERRMRRRNGEDADENKYDKNERMAKKIMK